MPIPCKDCPYCETCSPTNIGAVCKPKAKTKSEIIKDLCKEDGGNFKVITAPVKESDPLDFNGVPTGYGTKQCPSGHAVSIYAQAVEQDHLFAQEMIKTMTPEQINRFCFENGFSVPEPKEKGQ